MRRNAVGVAVLSWVLALGSSSSARAQTAPDPDKAFQAFLATCWNSSAEYFTKNSDGSGGWADFWWEAHFFETTLDAYEATGNASYRALLDQIYDGFVQMRPDFKFYTSFDNRYTDDLGWWAHALARANELTGEARFRDRAISIFSSLSLFEDATYGGGVWWRRDGGSPQKNMCTNGPYTATAVELYKITGDTRYLTKAREVFAWLDAHFIQVDGTVLDDVGGAGTGAGNFKGPDFTYDYGTFIGAAVALARATGDPSYLKEATRAADHVMTKYPILPAEGSGDPAGFKMILTRNLVSLARAAGGAEQQKIAAFLVSNAQVAWDHRNAAGVTDQDWSSPAGAVVQSFAAASAVDAEFDAVLANPAFPAPPVPAPAPPQPPVPPSNVLVPSPLPGVDFYDIPHATLHGLSTETLHEDVAGACHVAGWNHDGQSIDFQVTVPADGTYTLAFRYAAGAGCATRVLTVNGAVVNSLLLFPSGPSWDDARMVCIPTVSLHAGANTVNLAFDSTKLSLNYLNVDRLSVAVAPGGLGTAVTSELALFVQEIQEIFGL
jgi:predicted alpha-1,6-mannanase (GH76 family)